jgi:hypothetical protein
MSAQETIHIPTARGIPSQASIRMPVSVAICSSSTGRVMSRIALHRFPDEAIRNALAQETVSAAKIEPGYQTRLYMSA